MSDVVPATVVPATPDGEYSRWRLLTGILGRTWLWFVVGCVVITLLPLALGWRSYVVQSGSMAPRIQVGDVVIADQERIAEELFGRVTVFTAPGTGRTTVHRTIAVNDDGTLTTKGDANLRPDSSPVPLESVQGMARLLVRWVGLPLIWVSTGQWGWLTLFLVSLLVAAVAAARDREDPVLEDEEDDDPPYGGPPVPDGTDPLRTPAPAPAAGVLVRASGPVRSWLLSMDLWPVRSARSDGTAAAVAAPVPARATIVPVPVPAALDVPVGTPSVVPPATARHAAPGGIAVPAARHAAGPRVPARTAAPAALLAGLQRADLWPVRGARRPLPATAAAAPAATWRTLRRALDVNLPSTGAMARTAHVVVLVAALMLPVAGAGFMGLTRSVTNVWAAAASFADYTTTVTSLGSWLYWKLDETTGTVAADTSGNGRTGVYAPSAAAFTRGVTGAITSGTPNRAVTLNGTTACLTSGPGVAAAPAPSTFTVSTWFRSTSTAGGKLVGFESVRTGALAYSSGGRYDRHLYLDASGKLRFGVANGTTVTALTSSAALNDGGWHMAVGVLSPSGMRLYVDGALVASNTTATASAYTGWWRAGCGNLSGWGPAWDGGGSPSASFNQSRDFPFAGSLDEVAVWTSALTPTQVAALYAAR